MKTNTYINIAELDRHGISADSFQQEFAVIDIDSNFNSFKRIKEKDAGKGFNSVRIDQLFFLLVTEGTAQISIDYTPHTLCKNTFLILLPTHTIQPLIISPDFKGKLLMVTRAFLDECTTNNKGKGFEQFMYIRKEPWSIMEEKHAAILNNYMTDLQNKIHNRTHFLQKDMLQNALIGFFIEVRNIFISKNGMVAKTTLSRKEELFEQFLRLLFKHCKEEHSVTFYADKLFITPQYLSLILKGLSGKSANKWINDAIIIEAKTLLKTPQMTVQRVADTLHFSDQSTFGKFFKKHIGISPTEYKKSV